MKDPFISMKVLLILNNDYARDVRLLVRLHTKGLSEKVTSLLQKHQYQDAFKLVISKAVVECYIPRGMRPLSRPDLILVEDIL